MSTTGTYEAPQPNSADVPTMDEFNALKAQVDAHDVMITDLDSRVTTLEQGSPQPIAPSPDGTTVTDTTGSIVDAEGRTFKLVGPSTNYSIDMDGTVSGANVLRLYAKGGKCYQENVDHMWWYMGDTDWIASSDPTGAAPTPPSGTVFSDEFASALSLWNAYAPDSSKTWQLSRWYGNDWFGWKCNDGWMVNPWNAATPWPDMYKLDGNGSLALDVRKTPTNQVSQLGGCKYLTAQVNSLSFKKKGGYWEGRIKCPNIQGTNMAFWMMGTTTWPPEIDILEMVNQGHTVVMAQTLWHTDQTTEHYYAYNDKPFDWHTYGMFWDDANKRMTYWYDGKKTIDTAVPSGYNDPMFIILGSQQGGDWSGPIPDGAQLGPLLFDYVRCYDHPPQSLATAEAAPMTTSKSDAQVTQQQLADRLARRPAK